METDNRHIKSYENFAFRVEWGDAKNINDYDIKNGLTKFANEDEIFEGVLIISHPEKDSDWKESLVLTLDGKLMLVEENYERGTDRYELLSKTPLLDFLKEKKTDQNQSVDFFSEGHLLDTYKPEDLDLHFNGAYTQLLVDNGYGA